MFSCIYFLSYFISLFIKEKNNAATKIQAAFKGFIIRKKLPVLKEQLSMEKQIRAATLIQVHY